MVPQKRAHQHELYFHPSGKTGRAHSPPISWPDEQAATQTHTYVSYVSYVTYVSCCFAQGGFHGRHRWRQ